MDETIYTCRACGKKNRIRGPHRRSGYYQCGQCGCVLVRPKRVHHGRSNEFPSRKGRVGHVASRIRRASGLPYFVEIVSEIDGATLQGVALADRKLVRVTAAAVDLLNDNELAWLVAHEFAHLSLRHSATLKEKAGEFADAIFTAVKENHQKRKDLGHSLLRRSLSTGLRSVAAAAATVVVEFGQSREHEREADEWATRTTLFAGFDPTAGASLLRKLYDGSLPSLGFTQQLVSTHLDPQSRVDHILRCSRLLTR